MRRPCSPARPAARRSSTSSSCAQRFGLDQPVLVQLWLYVKNILVLDLGYSFRNASPVLPLILARLWPTLLLMGTTLLLSVAGGVLLGLLAAIWVRTWKDHVISFAAIIAYAMPLFWIGLMLILVFSIKLDWLPTSGMEDAAAFYEGWERVVDIARHLVLPAVTLSLFYMALYARLMRATMLEQRGLDYVTTARAKGLTERQITLRHMVRNALLPVVTVAGVQVGGLLGGSVVVESVFALAGPRPARLPIAVRARSQSAARHLLHLVVPGGGREHHRRRHLSPPRSAHQGRLMHGFWRRFLGNPRVGAQPAVAGVRRAACRRRAAHRARQPVRHRRQAVRAAARRLPVRHRLAGPRPGGRPRARRAHLAADRHPGHACGRGLRHAGRARSPASTAASSTTC